MSPTLTERRGLEHGKYVRAYRSSGYGMGRSRMMDAMADLNQLADPLDPGSYLDVGCGRGEMLAQARALSFNPVQGTEVVPGLIDGVHVVWAEGHELPFSDDEFDVVTMLDVIEHLIPGDDELTCRELLRVARRCILLTANNKTSQKAIGEELHINRRPYEEWDGLFNEWFDGQATWLHSTAEWPRHNLSQTWRVNLVT